MELLGYADARRVMSASDMVGHLIVVSREHADLYVYLRDRFARTEENDVAIILDRRLVERRRQTVSVDVERRGTDRRSRPEVDAHLRERSHVVVNLA